MYKRYNSFAEVEPFGQSMVGKMYNDGTGTWSQGSSIEDIIILPPPIDPDKIIKVYSGQVLDSKDRTPVTGATITAMKGGGILARVAAGSTGSFRLEVNDLPDSLVVSAAEYKEAKFSPDTSATIYTIDRIVKELDPVILTSNSKNWLWLIPAGLLIYAATKEKKKP